MKERMILKHSAFTLIELLIVVAIIAILAAIAVPNFMEAQIRAKTTRVKNDLRTVDLALTSYFSDNNAYPPEHNGTSWGDPCSERTLWRLSTPVSYISSAKSVTQDLFVQQGAGNDAIGKNWVDWNMKSYFYCNYKDFGRMRPGATDPRGKWNGWGMSSLGPDHKDNGILWMGYLAPVDRANWGAGGKVAGTNVYDPSNGTISIGDISRWGGEVPGDVVSVYGYSR